VAAEAHAHETLDPWRLCDSQTPMHSALCRRVARSAANRV
jgi:hypothetical protein